MSERGGILLVLLLLLSGIFLFIVFFVMWVAQIAGVALAGSTVQPGPSHQSNNQASTQQQSNNKPAYGEGLDFGGAELVCVRLPGVNYPKTPALDRRVARRLVAAERHMDAEGIAARTYTYGFRTTCQQREVNPGPNLKARPGTSPHEGGRAVDMNGMSSRSDRARIIQIMGQHDFGWLGVRDPPHFQVDVSVIGELSNGNLIRKAQSLFKLGQPREGCRGSECGN